MRKEDVVIVGDNMETDILCGVQAGIETILVTTGVHDRQAAAAYSFAADHIIEDLRELMD
ncbi:MAG: HAD hydrolase-like protein [Holdemania filiformis]